MPPPNLTVYGSKTLCEVIASLVAPLKIPKFFPDELDPLVYVRLFHPCMGEDSDYYLLDFDPQTGHCEAYVNGDLGLVDIGELGKVFVGGLKFEVAKYFKPCRLSKVRGD